VPTSGFDIDKAVISQAVSLFNALSALSAKPWKSVVSESVDK
jgi:hypothetical protein